MAGILKKLSQQIRTGRPDRFSRLEPEPRLSTFCRTRHGAIMADPQRLTIDTTEGRIAALHWPRVDAPRLVFLHANGFCASAYRQVLAPLTQTYDILAYDLRGHGRTALPADPPAIRGWNTHADDLVAVLETLDDRPIALAGHSMGGVISLLATARLQAKPAAVCMLDPVILPFAVYATAHGPLWPLASRRMPLRVGALRRRDGWRSREAVIGSYGAKPAFARWADGVLEDYLDDGLIEDDDGVRLACAPAWEAANYAAQRHWPVAAAKSAGVPAHVLRAGEKSTVMNANALTKAGASLDTLDGASHLLAMEKPQDCAIWLKARLDSAFT
jgi:pimeloyl-ACP methyl ester carboxylesterase